MAVKRVVTNIRADNLAAAKAFYGDILGMDVAMDLGWILTFAADAAMTPQLSVATEGGSGTAVPDISIEIDDLDRVYRKMIDARIAIEYDPASKPWGVRRFYVRDPFGQLVNILSHG
jgi:catechol 2,3-dioxygenase-like lactoylglutathione lyase family enzyme